MTPKGKKLVRITITAVLVALMTSCGSQESPAESGEGESEGLPRESAAAPVVPADGGAGLVYTWIDESGDYHVSTVTSEIPEDRRAIVRVQDPTIPPGNPGEVWVADLREAKGGRFQVKSMKRAHFEKIAQPRQPPRPPQPGKTPPAPPAEDGEPPRVVMYSTSSCPVCRQARRWLSKQGVSFVERNLERDDAAARQLQEKARQQGVPANGVPIFEIQGKLIPGFNKQALTAALGRSPG